MMLGKLVAMIRARRAKSRQRAEGLTSEGSNPIIDLIKPFTMVHETGVRFSIDAAMSAIEIGLPGVIAECGVWRGGCSLAILLAQRMKYGTVVKPVHLFDSFEGLPAVSARDGSLAMEWQKGHTATFYDNCKAELLGVKALFLEHGFAEGEDFVVWPGWFEDTVPIASKSPMLEAGIAMLRLDGDWYDSTKICLEYLEPLVALKGTIIIDDYYAWDGCARAVHDYLSGRDLPYRLKSLPHYFAAFMEKFPERESFDRF